MTPQWRKRLLQNVAPFKIPVTGSPALTTIIG